MSSRNIILGRDLNVKDFHFKEPKTNTFGGKMVYVNYGADRRKLLLQTPRLKVPFGMSKYEQGDVRKFTLDMGFEGWNTGPDNSHIKQFLTNLQDLDERLLDEAVANGRLWLGRNNPSKDAIKFVYTPIVKYAKNKDTGEIENRYPPRMSVRLYEDNDRTQFDVKCFNQETREEIVLNADNHAEEVPPGSYVRAIISPSFVWFASGKFGMGWKAVQIQVEPPAVLRGCAIVDSDREEDGEQDGDDIHDELL